MRDTYNAFKDKKLETLWRRRAETGGAATDHNHTGVYEPADSTILKDADIGVSVAAFDHNHVGQMAAANVDVAYNGKTVEQCLVEIYAALAGAGPSAPVIATVPTIDDTTPVVGQTITATATSDPASTTKAWQWNADGLQISGATAATFTVQVAQHGKYLTVTQRSTNNTGGLFSESTSAATSAVGGTVPTNSVAPTISPNGSQAVGQEHTVDPGTWSGASTYGIQFYYSGVPEGARSAVTTITPDSTKAGLILTYDVIGYSSVGIPSATAVAGSNSVTLTGTPSVVNTGVPTWPANLYFGIPADFTGATWTGAIDSVITWEFFRNSETVPYVSPPNTISIHTPRSPAVVGDTLYIKETVTETSTGAQYTSWSAGKTISAAPATLAVSLTTAGTAGYVWTVGLPIAQANPATISGGTGPFTATIANLAWGTVSVSNRNVFINGTPPSVVPSGPRTITIVDSAGTPATVIVDFTVQVNPSVIVTPLSSAGYPVATTFEPDNYGMYDGTSTVTLGGIIKQAVEPDPSGSGRSTYVMRVSRSQWIQNVQRVRAENLWIDHSPTRDLMPGTDYWFAFAYRPKSGEWPISTGWNSDEEFIIFQTHSESAGDTQPDIGLFIKPYDGTCYWQRSYSVATPSPSDGSAQTADATPIDWSGPIPIINQWTKVIIHYRPGYLAAHAPKTEIWMAVNGGAYVKVVNKVANTDFNTYNFSTGSYPRIGLYKWRGTNWNPNYASIALNYTTLYYGTGVNLYPNAEASLVGL